MTASLNSMLSTIADQAVRAPDPLGAVSQTCPITWSRLTDELLTKFGAKYSVRTATIAINTTLRAWGCSTRCAMIIADESVLNPESMAEDLAIVDELGPWHANVAFNEDGKERSAADRLTCALAILSAHSIGTDNDGAREERLRKAQIVVTEILLLHPVLLHPRLVIPYRVYVANKARPAKYMSVLTAIMMTGFAQLPSVRHGVDPARVKAFAKSKLIMAPIDIEVPKTAFAPNSSLEMNHIHVTYSGMSIKVGSTLSDHPSPEFFASQMEIGRLRGTSDWPHISLAHNDLSVFYVALPRAAGQLYLYGSQVEPRKYRVCEHLFDEAVLSAGLMQHERVRRNLLRFIQRSTLQSDGDAPFDLSKDLPQWAVETNTTLALGMLKRIGLAKDAVDAAQWLYREYVCGGDGEGRNLCLATLPGAMGFLESLTAAGMKLPEAKPDGSFFIPGLKGNPLNFSIWKTAHEIVSRKRAMESVLNAAAGPVVPETDIEPKQRRRGLKI